LIEKLAPAVLTAFFVGCTAAPQPPSGETTTASSGLLALRFAGRLDPPSGPGRFDPSVIAVDAKDRLLVADAARGTIFVYDGPGPPVGWLAEPPPGGSVGAGPRFQDIRSIVTSSGLDIFVLDAGPGRVYSYDLTNQLRGTTLDLEGSAVEGRFGRVRGTALAIDRSGQPIVADEEGDRLLVFNPQWEPAHTIGGPGLTSGGFRDPTALAIDSRGRILVADRGNRLVQLLSPVGGYLDEYRTEHPPESVVTNSQGDIFVGDAAGFILILPASGGRSLVAPPERNSGPAYLALSEDGRRLYVSRPLRGAVDIMDIVPSGASP
jgi:DNA-binding beta-propeller fold protein YncE